MTERHSSWTLPGFASQDAVREFAAVAAAFVLVFVFLSPANQWSYFPVHHDDFSNLTASTWGDALRRFSGPPVRPVSHVVIGIVSAAGLTAYVTALHLLTLAYTWLALRCTVRIFAGDRVPLPVLLAAAVISFSVEHTIEWLKYTGLLTNQLAGVFGLACVAVMLGRQQREIGGRLRAGLWALAAASFWSKEDFVVPVLLTAAYLAYLSWRTQPGLLRDRLFLLAGLVTLAALLALYNRSLNSSFTQSTAGTYAANFQIWSVLKTAAAYLTSSPSRLIVLALQFAAFSWNYFAGTPVAWSRFFFWQALIAALLFPYACLPHHMADYYAPNWFTFQAAGALLLAWRLKPNALTAVVLAALAAAPHFPSYKPRNAMADWYAKRGAVNRNIVAFLVAQREALRPYPRVAVEGAPPQGPWFGTDGGFLAKRYGLQQQWLILLPDTGEYYSRVVALLGPGGVEREGQIRHLLAGRDPVPPGVPRIRINPDGTGTVELPPR